MSIKNAKHNDFFGDIPPSMEFGDLWLPPGAAQQTSCNRCRWTYFSIDPAVGARALMRHQYEEHSLYPNVEEERKMATSIRRRR